MSKRARARERKNERESEREREGARESECVCVVCEREMEIERLGGPSEAASGRARGGPVACCLALQREHFELMSSDRKFKASREGSK